MTEQTASVVKLTKELIARTRCKACHHPGASQCRGPDCWCWESELRGADAILALATAERDGVEASEYRKLELLWKEACVAREDYKMQADAKDALWMGAIARAETAESALEAAQVKVAKSRENAIYECISILEELDDCSPRFIADKLRDLVIKSGVVVVEKDGAT